MNFPELVNTLVDIYKKSNTRIIGGYPNHFTNTSEASLFNYVLKNNKIISTSGSISNDELFVIYNLSKYINPTNIYIIGNSYGISTIFLSLLFPKSNLLLNFCLLV